MKTKSGFLYYQRKENMMYNRTIYLTALPGRLFLCPEIAVHHPRPPPVSVQAINPSSRGRIPLVDIGTFDSPCQTLSTISDQEFFKWLAGFCSCAPRIYRCLSHFMLYLKNQKVLYSQKCQGMLSCLIIL